MSRICSDCPKSISACSAGRCVSCAARAKYADPQARAAMSAAKKRALADPVKRSRVASAASDNLRAWHKSTTIDWSAYHRARAEKARSWCPAELWDDYQALRKMRGVGAAEARRMIEERIPGTQAHARRIVANHLDAQRIRHARDVAQSY